MATRIGLEPTTPSVTGWCSNQLSYRAMIAQVSRGAYRRNVLYYIEKASACQAWIYEKRKKAWKSRSKPALPCSGPAQQKRSTKEKRPEIFRLQGIWAGAAIQIRTGDLILTKDALYQLSYSSTIAAQLWYHRFCRLARGFCKKIRIFLQKPLAKRQNLWYHNWAAIVLL